MGGTGKARHVRADLREDGGRRDWSTRGHGQQELDRLVPLGPFGHQVGAVPLQALDALLQVVDVVEQVTDELTVMGVHAPRQGQSQGGQLLAQPPFGELG
jgi:hypothetical protein